MDSHLVLVVVGCCIPGTLFCALLLSMMWSCGYFIIFSTVDTNHSSCTLSGGKCSNAGVIVTSSDAASTSWWKIVAPD